MTHQFTHAFNLVLDEMLTAEGVIKILEFQPLGQSDVHGYYDENGQELDIRAQNFLEQFSFEDETPPHLIAHISENKAAAATFAYPILTPFLPWQKVYAYVDGQKPIEDIRANCPTENIVIKIPQSSCGDGVFYAVPSHDGFQFPEHSEAEINFRFGSFFSAGNNVPAQNLLVAQECVTPKSVTIEGKSYTPTIRTVASILWNAHNSTSLPKVEIHGSYYKLGAPLAHTGIVGPDNLKSHATFYGRTSLEKADQRIVAEQSLAAIQQLWSFSLTHNPESTVLQALRSDNLGDAVSALGYLRDFESSHQFSGEFRHHFIEAATSLFKSQPRIRPLIAQFRLSESQMTGKDNYLTDACDALYGRPVGPFEFWKTVPQGGAYCSVVL